MKPIILDGHSLTLSQFEQVVYRYAPVQLAPTAIKKMQQSRNEVEQLVQEGKTVYGITTGFGKFSDVVIDQHQSNELQLNLIRSHACGVGKPLSIPAVRGIMLLRANALAKGFSGVRPEVVHFLLSLLALKIHPVIPEQGSLGASGDLAPLAHMTLPLLGLGEVYYENERISGGEALQRAGLTPLRLEAKEGLALINGTQMMTSLTALALLHAQNLLLSADIIASLTVEALSGIPHAYHPLLHHARGQLGQITTAKNMLLLLTDSGHTTEPGERRVQDAYSLRCIPQVHGASKDTYQYVEQILNRELNAATDNPLIFSDEGEIISGGNFHGQPIALAADFLSIALAEIGNISERRTERLVNPSLSDLPAFLTKNGGLHSGYMILQYVAAALVSENKTLCHPASVDSIPSSANQEDHVSMGSIGSRKLLQVVDNLYSILAVEYVCAAQALEFHPSLQLGAGGQSAYDLLREQVSPLTADREGHQDIEAAANVLRQGSLVKKVLPHHPLQL
ncbi:histidine ammonia-lyase [Mechercharimyces sp. CAU 1602]|uniref:histidine ammonia-lyase n=1 Tax=Mechercharimyces sp. CAU 1602 TaxID=2973933 RepID=UPI002161CEFD|nr:histidine ammonia-lyase [Mechercharimyces sp. CAU 1602]MCS1350737.1 histidine ammonia-lyase [Mechercharimyces sp. CAU 1602]